MSSNVHVAPPPRLAHHFQDGPSVTYRCMQSIRRSLTGRGSLSGDCPAQSQAGADHSRSFAVIWAAISSAAHDPSIVHTR